MSKPLVPGDMVKVYDASSFGAPRTGKVIRAYTSSLDVQLDIGRTWSGFRRQCVRLKNKDRPSERVFFWAAVFPDSCWYAYRHEKSARDTANNAVPRGRVCKAVELLPGERTISKEELKNAWAAIGINDEEKFEGLCRNLNI